MGRKKKNNQGKLDPVPHLVTPSFHSFYRHPDRSNRTIRFEIIKYGRKKTTKGVNIRWSYTAKDSEDTFLSIIIEVSVFRE